MLEWAADQASASTSAWSASRPARERLGDTIKIGRRGSLTGRLTVRGRQGHAAYPQRADNAAHRLVAVLAAPDRDAARPWHRLVRALEPAGHHDRHRQPGQQRHPGEASARFNIRFNDRHTRDSLDHWLRRQIAPLAPDFELSVLSNAEAFVTAAGPLSELLAASIEAETGLRRLSTSGGTSDARFIPPYCPVVEFGLVGTTMHQADENVAVADIEGLTRIYQRFVREFLAS